MIKNFKNNPEKVLQDFYSKCNFKFDKSSINYENLLNALNYLDEDKLEREFFKIKFKIGYRSFVILSFLIGLLIRILSPSFCNSI